MSLTALRRAGRRSARKWVRMMSPGSSACFLVWYSNVLPGRLTDQCTTQSKPQCPAAASVEALYAPYGGRSIQGTCPVCSTMASLAPQISEAGSAALGSDVWVTVWFWMDAIGSRPFQYGQ